VPYPHRHLLAIEGLHPPHIAELLDLAESYALLNRQGKTQRDLLKGRKRESDCEAAQKRPPGLMSASAKKSFCSP
jgi:hypothetical protein